MPSEPAGSPPASLFEKAREVVSDRTVLLVCDPPCSPELQWIAQTLSSTEALAAPRPESRHACALIVTPWVEAEQLDAVIANLRDFLSLELYVLHPGNAAEQTRRMGALGLRCLEVFDVDGQPWGLNHFSLKTYKKTPGWLNNRFWANPQLWNRFRW